MPFFTRPYLNDDQFQQIATDVLTLYGETDFQGILKSKGVEIDASGGTFGYVLTFDGTKIKLMPSAASGASALYGLDSPSTITVGGIPAGTDLINGNAGSGFTTFDLWEKLLVVYQVPTFSFFNNSISSLNQVGNPINWSGNTTFSWNTTNSGNVSGNSISIIDTSNPFSPLGQGLANDGSESLALGLTINNNIPISHTWQIKGKNTEGDDFQKNY